jgi:hypothetical protein
MAIVMLTARPLAAAETKPAEPVAETPAAPKVSEPTPAAAPVSAPVEPTPAAAG